MTRLLQCSVLPSLAAFIYFYKHFFLYFLFEKYYFFFLLTSKSLLYILDVSLYQVYDLQILYVAFTFLFHLFMKDNHFTILCWPLSYINMNQPQVYIRPLPLEPPSHLLPRPTHLGYHRTLDLSSLCHTVNFHWLSNFTNGNVCVSMLLSQFVLPSANGMSPCGKRVWQCWRKGFGLSARIFQVQPLV